MRESPFTGPPLPIPLDSGLEKAPDVPLNTFVSDAVGHELHQVSLIHGVEKATSIGLRSPADRPIFHRPAERPQGIMTPLPRPESIGIANEVLFIDRLETSDQSGLHQLVLKGCMPKGRCFALPGLGMETRCTGSGR